MKIGAKDIQHLSERGHLMRLQESTNQNEILTASSTSALDSLTSVAWWNACSMYAVDSEVGPGRHSLA
jgi:hypothetical protein